MNYKLNYITRIFEKTSHKRIENYVITRIWHLLKSDEIKMMHQQYVDLGQGQRALTDLYFPQIDYHVEVDEEYHLANKEADQIREAGIISRTGHIVRRIDCSNEVDLHAINRQVDTVVEEINKLIEERKEPGNFIAWSTDELTPEFWKNRGVISVRDNVNLTTIDDIGKLFDVRIINRGYLKAGAAKYEKDGYSQI
jgi:very-short-patch-repair endonuclease